MAIGRAAIILSLIAATPASAAGQRGVERIVAHHVAAMKRAALNEIMSDYADDAVVVTPSGLMPTSPPNRRGAFVGKARARAVFARLTDAENIAGIRGMETRIQVLSDDVAVLHWVQFRGSPRQVSGQDYFVVHDGKITLQDIVIAK